MTARSISSAFTELGLTFNATLEFPKTDVNGDPIPGETETINLFDGYNIATTACLNENNQVCAAAFTRTVSAVPVPAAFWLFVSAMLGFAGYTRRFPDVLRLGGYLNQLNNLIKPFTYLNKQSIV